MRDLIRRGEVTSLSDIALEGSEQWQAAGNCAELQRYFALAAAKRQPVTRPSTGFTPTFAIGTLIVVAGFVFAISSLGDFLNGIASSRWPSAEARLIYTQEIDESRWWDVMWGRRSHRLTGSHKWRLYVGYEYLVNGQKYHSNAISFGSEFDTAVHQRHRFQYAKPLFAHYDPATPGRAVLDPGVTLGSVGTLVGGGVVMLLGGLIAFVPGFSRRAVDTISTMSAIFLRR
jgi:hypothetical protein